LRLVEFLIHVLEAHAQTLQRLAALLGEEELVEALERYGELLEASGEEPRLRADPAWFDSRFSDRQPVPFDELESAVASYGLSPPLEFHLWAYPHYRAFIESPLDLGSRIPGPGGDVGLALADEAVSQAEAWVRGLPVPPELGPQAERAAHVPWLRFRATVLKRVGRRPLGPVY
jgi:hypothetical protein